MPLVSIVIPAYNCSLYIAQTINSILAQEGPNDIEILVVDDGSTDNTGEIARNLGRLVRVIEQRNGGVSAARNRGINEAKGEFIALVDHDDYWFPRKLINQLAAFQAHPDVDVVYSDFIRWRVDSDGKFKDPSAFASESLPQGVDDQFSGWIYHQMLLDSWVLTSTALVRSHSVLASGGFDNSLPFSEDWDFWLRISKESKFLKLREKSTLYRQHAEQGSRIIRSIDYRTRLLENASNKWGLCSQDGRCVPPNVFRRQLAKYSASFGLGHLSERNGANRTLAAKSFLKAWAIDQSYLRSLAYLAAMAFGWKPKYF